MEKLPDIMENFAEWYQEVVFQSELLDISPTKGCFVIRPYGYSIWENIQNALDKKIKSSGAQNAYFPLLIPKSFIQREAQHIEGFSPELAVVTYAGGKELEEELVVRPTSETIIYYMFSRWISSWRDLPLKVNQWANVLRWEMRTRAFLRSTEFLWQEGHTAHATFQEAVDTVLQMLQVYQEIYKDFLAVPFIAGLKSQSERFAGAERTYTLESIMPDSKALQLCTSHLLAHSFPEVFDIKFQDKDGSIKVPWCTSWGFTTRAIGALVMTHGDSKGLIIPPRVAPVQCVIIPIYKTDQEKELIYKKSQEIKDILLSQNIRAIFDSDDQKSPGAKYYHWELRGVPVRIEIGPKDLEKNQVVLVSRLEDKEIARKTFVSFEKIVSVVQDLLNKIQETLYFNANTKMISKWKQGEKLTDFSRDLEEGGVFYQAGWCGNTQCEALLKNHKGTIRCLREEKKHEKCFACDNQSINDVIIAKSY